MSKFFKVTLDVLIAIVLSLCAYTQYTNYVEKQEAAPVVTVKNGPVAEANVSEGIFDWATHKYNELVKPADSNTTPVK